MVEPTQQPDLVLYTVKEVAYVCRLTPYTIRQYLRDGIITGTKIGKSWRVSADDLTKYLEGKHG